MTSQYPLFERTEAAIVKNNLFIGDRDRKALATLTDPTQQVGYAVNPGVQSIMDRMIDMWMLGNQQAAPTQTPTTNTNTDSKPVDKPVAKPAPKPKESSSDGSVGFGLFD